MRGSSRTDVDDGPGRQRTLVVALDREDLGQGARGVAEQCADTPPKHRGRRGVEDVSFRGKWPGRSIAAARAADAIRRVSRSGGVSSGGSADINEPRSP